MNSLKKRFKKRSKFYGKKLEAKDAPQKKLESLPATFDLLCQATIEAAAGDGESKTPRFSMTAYTGGKMTVAGFPHPVVVDLRGLSIPRQNLPVRLDHKSDQGVGHTTDIVIVDNSIMADGLISRETQWARDVAKSGTNGFPWQASIGAEVLEAEFISPGQSVAVNGRTFKGPLQVIRRAVLHEISFVDSGADSRTSATVAAKETEIIEQPQETTDMDKDKEKPKEDVENPDKNKPVQDEPAVPADQPEKLEAAQPNPIDEYRKNFAAETRRIEAIRKLCDGKHSDIEAKAIEEGWDEMKTELHVLRASRPAAPAIITGSQVKLTAQILEAAAMMAAGFSGLETAYPEQTLDAADKLRGIGIQEFCERASGQRLPRFRSDADGWLRAAFSTASLPGILSNIANKMLLEGYNYVEDAWRLIVKIASVNDFKEHVRYRMTSDFAFKKIGSGGELKHGEIGEQKFSQKADTFGIMFALSRQMIIDDDMGAFTDIPRQIGIGAAEAIAEAVWTLLLGNPGSFFSANHNNYKEGTDTALSIDGLTHAEILFLAQTKPNGKPLGVAPKIMLVPTALKVLAEVLMKSLKLNETTTADKGVPQDNPHAGKFSVVTSTYLSNSTFTGHSAKAWYLFADPNRIPAIEVAFLNGVDRPTVEKADADFNTLGVQFRGYIDFGVREQDYRGALKMKGEA